MKFNYSVSHLMQILGVRLLPSIPFLICAFIFGNIFWIATLLLWIEAIAEIIYRKNRGYLWLDGKQIRRKLLFVTDNMDVAGVKEVFVYGDEWNFIPKEGLIDIRLNIKNVEESQRNKLKELLNEFWNNIRENQS